MKNITKLSVIASTISRQNKVNKVMGKYRKTQLTTDAFNSYMEAVKENSDTDYEMQHYFKIWICPIQKTSQSLSNIILLVICNKYCANSWRCNHYLKIYAASITNDCSPVFWTAIWPYTDITRYRPFFNLKKLLTAIHGLSKLRAYFFQK